MPSGAEYVVSNRTGFLHDLTGAMKYAKSDDFHRMGVFTAKACRRLMNQGNELELRDNDFPDAESREERDLFIIDAYQAARCRQDTYSGLRGADPAEREYILNEFYNSIREVVDRAVIRYEKLFVAAGQMR